MQSSGFIMDQHQLQQEDGGGGAGGMQPPFTGYIETTKDALLVFEAARRGMIPRVTRRLMDPEKGAMIRSGAVFVFDSNESGIKRWTDGMSWSPSRILGNFLVYREQPKEPKTNNTESPLQTSPALQQSPSLDVPGLSMSPPEPLIGLPMEDSPFGKGALRPKTSSDAMTVDKQRERQLVGSLTNNIKFKEGGLVKKTLSVVHGDVTQHMISYYTMADVTSGKLRSPTNLPEMASVEISADYLTKQNFRFPLQTEMGIDGVVRYCGEPHGSRYTKSLKENAAFAGNGQAYDYNGTMARPELGYGSRSRSIPMPMSIPIPPSSSMGGSYTTPGSAGSIGWFGSSMSPVEHQSYVRPGGYGHNPNRPGSSRSSRYDPYSSVTSPRSNSLSVHHQHRRESVSQQPPMYYNPNSQHGQSQAGPSHYVPSHPSQSHPGSGQQVTNHYQQDVKPVQGPDGQFYQPEYNVYDSISPQHAYITSPPPPSASSSSYHSSQYTGWQPPYQSQSHPGRISENVPRHIAAPPPAADVSQSVSGLSIAPTSMPPNTSPPPVFQTPGPSISQEWTQQPNYAWDPDRYPQGPPQYQPPPPHTPAQQEDSTDQQHYQMPAPSQEWRDGAGRLAPS